MVHQCLNLQERDVDKCLAAFELGSTIDENRKKGECDARSWCWCNRRRHPDQLSVENTRKHDASIVGREMTSCCGSQLFQRKFHRSYSTGAETRRRTRGRGGPFTLAIDERVIDRGVSWICLRTSNMLQVWSQFSTSTRVFIDQGNDDPCAFTTEAADSTPASANIGAAAELWRSGRCVSVCLGQSWNSARSRGIQRWT